MDWCWNEPTGTPPLSEDGLQIWRIDLGGMQPASREGMHLLERAARVLSAEEREIAARMRVGGPSEEFKVSRSCLRRLLGTVLRRDPAEIVFEKGLHGKPFVRTALGGVAPSFNVAHSHGMILIGLSVMGEIGVDVEFVDQTIDLEGVAQTAFHVDEVARVERANIFEDRLDLFYRCWARKEALAKADGRGLTLEPTTYIAGSDERGEQCVTLPDGDDGVRFFVREVDVGSSHRAALATKRNGVPVRTYRFPGQFWTGFPE